MSAAHSDCVFSRLLCVSQCLCPGDVLQPWEGAMRDYVGRLMWSSLGSLQKGSCGVCCACLGRLHPLADTLVTSAGCRHCLLFYDRVNYRSLLLLLLSGSELEQCPVFW